MGQTSLKKKKPPASYLYQVVYSSRYVYGAVLLLLISFIIQPIARATAAEASGNDQISVVVPEVSTNEIIPDVPWEPDEIDTVLNNGDELVIRESNATLVPAEQVTELSEGESNATLVPADQVTELSEGESIEINTENKNEPPPNRSADSDEVAILNTAYPDDTDLEQPPLLAFDSISTSTSTSTTADVDAEKPAVEGDESLVFESISESVEINPETNESELTHNVEYDDATFQFGKDACVQVADGSFYCQKSSTPVVTDVLTDGLYALPDKDGDLEIYIQKSGALTQVTHNTVDDASPYFDQLSNTLVWHRLINDRYQIIEYDMATGEEHQVTSGRVNNMEPVRAGKYTAWQYWGTAWDIVLSDGEKIIRLTESDSHDVAPSIRNGLVIWQRLQSDGTRTIELYDIKTAEYHTIIDTEGGVISNPRMIVAYESTDANGDVVTRGYDLMTGEVTTLGTLPVPLPERIPEPNETGEVVALVHAKTTIKDETETDEADWQPVGTSTNATPSPSLSEFDLIIGSEATASSTLTNTHEVFDTIPTLDLSNVRNESVEIEYASTTTGDTLTLVIPPYEAVTDVTE